jgi:hypothetical protein
VLHAAARPGDDQIIGDACVVAESWIRMGVVGVVGLKSDDIDPRVV